MEDQNGEGAKRNHELIIRQIIQIAHEYGTARKIEYRKI